MDSDGDIDLADLLKIQQLILPWENILIEYHRYCPDCFPGQAAIRNLAAGYCLMAGNKQDRNR